ncbi:hypothetical protein EDB80DRAFT_868314 [Ilyonectria destructans]|nr:hypothetical protein EDB80DRAFT_868314 [Ilyonectria destructans]
MSMYIPIQQYDRPAYTEALACEEGFQKLLVVVSKANTLKEPSGEIREYHEKFTLWAHRLRVFSDSMVSLDSRLEDYPSGPGVISANLYLLRLSLNKSFWFKTPTSSEDVEFRYKRKSLAKALETMKEAVEGLLEFSDIMHRSDTSTLAAKAKTFNLDVPPSEITKFEKETLRLVNQHADGIEDTLADRLTMGITFRRIRLLYETNHHKKLQSRPYATLPMFDIHAALAALDTPAKSNTSPLDLPSRSEPKATTTSTTMGGSTDTNDDALNDVDQTDSSDEDDDASVASSDLDYLCPEPPRLGDGESASHCTWCPEILNESDLNTPGWWRKHVKEDLEIYVCISDDCCNPTVYFKTFSEWHKHMKKAHGSNWSEEVYALHYFCDMDSCSYPAFTNRDKFEQHMNGRHGHELTNAQMDMKLRCNFTTIPREPNYCPICNRNIFTGLKLRSQLLKKPNKGKEREHVPQPQRREVEDSEELPSSDSDEAIVSYRIDDAEAQRRAKLISAKRRKLARHVGIHLKELAFLSIRGLRHTPRNRDFGPDSSVSETSSTESKSDTESELGELISPTLTARDSGQRLKRDQTMDDFPQTQGSRCDT